MAGWLALALAVVVRQSCWAAEADGVGQPVSISNYEQGRAPCRAVLPPGPLLCRNTVCTLPALPGAAIGDVELQLSCVSLSRPTGFENVPEDMHYRYLRTKNGHAHLGWTDNDQGLLPGTVRELSFCLTGQDNVLCGFARTWRLTDRPGADATPALVRFVEGIETEGPVVPPRQQAPTKPRQTRKATGPHN